MKTPHDVEPLDRAVPVSAGDGDAAAATFLEAAPDGVLVVDAEGRIVRVNPRLCAMFGATKDALVGQPVEHLVPTASRTRHAALRTGYAGSPTSRPMGSGLVLLGLGSDGRTFPVDVSLAPLPDGASPAGGFVAVVRDVTDRVEQQQRLEAALEAAQSATLAKSLFLALVSHELRAPLHELIGLAQLVSRTGGAATREDYLQRLMDTGTKLLERVDNLVDLTRMEAGRLRIESSYFCIDEVVEGAVAVVRKRAHEKGLIVAVERDASVPDLLFGDPLRITQILTNLLTNAVKFTERGTVCLHIAPALSCPEPTHPAAADAGRASPNEVSPLPVVFAVRDTGIGMTSEQCERVFEPFRPLENSAGRPGFTTGLGLSLTRLLVEQMGGTLSVESALGTGTRVEACLPLGCAPPTDLASPPVRLPPLHVLLIDDSAMAREVASRMLESAGMRVECVASARDGLARLHETHRAEASPEARFDVVLIDWRMGDEDGLDAIRSLRRSDQITPQPRVILTSTFARSDLENEALRAGADGFLAKPVRVATFVTKLAPFFAARPDDER